MPAAAGQCLPCADRRQVLHPAHLLRGQRLHLYRVSPAGSRYFQRPAAGGLAPGQQCRVISLAPSTRRSSPAAGWGGRRGTIGGSRRISFRAVARYPIEVSNSRSVPAGIVVEDSRGIVVKSSDDQLLKVLYIV